MLPPVFVALLLLFVSCVLGQELECVPFKSLVGGEGSTYLLSSIWSLWSLFLSRLLQQWATNATPFLRVGTFSLSTRSAQHAPPTTLKCGFGPHPGLFFKEHPLQMTTIRPMCQQHAGKQLFNVVFISCLVTSPGSRTTAPGGPRVRASNCHSSPSTVCL